MNLLIQMEVQQQKHIKDNGSKKKTHDGNHKNDTITSHTFYSEL